MWRKLARWSTGTMPVSRAFFFVFLSVLVVTGSTVLGTLYRQRLARQRLHDPSFQWTKLSVESRGPLRVPSAFVYQTLEVEEGEDRNLYGLPLAGMERRLAATALFKEVSLSVVPPSLLRVVVCSRTPVAVIADADNTLVDESGILFPHHPFYPNKDLPYVRLGLQTVHWGQRLDGPSFQLAMNLVQEVEKAGFPVKGVDVSQAEAVSYGRRELVCEVVEEEQSWLLRLPSRGWTEQLARFSQAKGRCPPAQVVDLRLNSLAFLAALETEG